MSRNLDDHAEQLIEHTAFVRAIARAVLARDDLADDAVQEGFASALRQKPRERGQLRAWFGGIVRNKALDIRRREARRNRREHAASRIEAVPGTASLVQQADAGRQLIERTLELPEPYRQVLLLRFHQGLPVRSVAKLLDVPIETVRTRQRRALERLRESMDERARNRNWMAALAPVALHASGAAAAGATIGGAVVVKKVAIGVTAALLLGGGAWWTFQISDHSPDTANHASDLLAKDSGVHETREPTLVPNDTALASTSDVASATTPPTTGRYYGTMRDESGKPVPEATLEVLRTAYMGDADLPRIHPDAAGRFAFEGFKKWRHQVSVRVHSTTHVPQWGGRERLVFPERANKIVLTPSVDVRVSVVDDETGEPVSGANVGAYGKLTSSPGALGQMRPYDEARTDAAGRATLRTKPGQGLLLAKAEGYRASMHAEFDVPSEGAERTVRLGRGGILNGRFVDQAGQPKAGVLIEAIGFPSYKRTLTSDAEGRFTLEDTPLQSDPPAPVLGYHLRLWCQIVGSDDGGARYFRVEPAAKPGATAEVTLTWLAPRLLSGRVLHADGRPVADITVTATPKRARLDNWSAQPVRTSADGTFRFERCLPGLVRVQVREEGSTGKTLVQQVVELSSEGATAPIELVLPAPPSDEPQLTVSIRKSSGELVHDSAVRWNAVKRGGTSHATAPAPQGVATLTRGVREGLFVWADSPGYVPHGVTLTAEDRERGKVEIRFPDGTATGRIVRQDGSPMQLPLRAVQVIRMAGSRFPQWLQGNAELRSEKDGRFRLEGLGEGTFRLGLGDMTFRLVGGRIEVQAGERDITLVVGTEAELHDLFVEAQLMDGETQAPLTGWHLQLRLVKPGAPADADLVQSLQAVTGSQSLFRTFDPVAPGTYDIVIPAMFGRREARASGIRVGHGIKRTRAILTWERGLSITGRVTNSDGNPAGQVQLRAGQQTAVVGKDGTYRISGLEPGEVEVTIDGNYAEPHATRVDVQAGAANVADFQVHTGGAVRVVPPSAVGPLRSLVVNARPMQGGSEATLELTAKQYEMRAANHEQLFLSRLAPGRWHVSVDWDGKRIASKEIEVRDRETTKVHLPAN